MVGFGAMIVLLISFIISILLVPIIIKVSDRNGFHDYVNERKIHNGKISRLGGLAIFCGFAASLLYLLITDFNVPFKVYLFVIATFIAFLTGFIDDIYHIKARYKLMLQLLCGLLVAFADLKISKITLATGVDIQFGLLSYIITMIWVAGFMNAINLLDGMDGLASGVVIISSAFIAIIGFLQGNIIVSLLALALIGAIFGFFIFNYPPAKIFMGDGGAYFLGFMYAILPLIGFKKASSVLLFIIPIVLLLIPLVDIINVIRKRVEGGYSIFIADKNHIHHRLLNIGFTNRGIIWVFYGYTFIMGNFAILMHYLKPHESIIILFLLFLLTILAFYTVSVAEKKIEDLSSQNGK